MSEIVPSDISIRITPVWNAIKHHTSILAHKSLSLEHLFSLWRAQFLSTKYCFDNIFCLFWLQAWQSNFWSLTMIESLKYVFPSYDGVVIENKVEVLKLSYLLASAILHTTNLKKTFIKKVWKSLLHFCQTSFSRSYLTMQPTPLENCICILLCLQFYKIFFKFL